MQERSVRSDVQRSGKAIRAGALAEFARHGLNVPLEQIAEAAGVSKGTIYNHFGGRAGLIDAVVDEMVSHRLDEVVRRARQESTGWLSLRCFLLGSWQLQFQDPVANDVFAMSHLTSAAVARICQTAASAGAQFLHDAQREGMVLTDLTGEDLYMLTLAHGAFVRDVAGGQQERQARFAELMLRGLLIQTRPAEDE